MALISQSQLGQTIYGKETWDFFGHEVESSADGEIVAIGSSGNDEGGEAAGQVRIFKLGPSGKWLQMGSDINGSWRYVTSSSLALSANGNVLAVGSSGYDELRGLVCVYMWDGIEWVHMGACISGDRLYDWFGSALDISADGNRLAIGASHNSHNAEEGGQVKVFEFDGRSWNQLGSDLLGHQNEGYFGSALSMSSNGEKVAITSPGSLGHTPTIQHVSVFEWNGNDWVQLGDSILLQSFKPVSVALSGDNDVLAVGMPSEKGNQFSKGQVKVFQFDGSEWTQIGQEIEGEVVGSYTGSSVALSSDGNIVAVGAKFHSENDIYHGHVRVFQRNDNEWLEIVRRINGKESNDRCGSSAELSDDGRVLVVGSEGVNEFTGSVGVFELWTVHTNDLKKNDDITIYPNPASDKCLIQSSSTLRKIAVIDEMGVVIRRIEFLKEPLKTFTLDLNSLVCGSYCLQIETVHQVATQRILIF